jgi:hypothetical protein
MTWQECTPPNTHVTGVQLRAEGPITARLLCGGPFSIVASDLGEIALLPIGRVAAYVVTQNRTAAVFVFRNETRGELTAVPGVGRPVRLLLSSRRRGTAKRTRNLIQKLTRYGYDPSDLSDEFWLRAAGSLLARRRPHVQLLASLVALEDAPRTRELRPRRRGARDGRLSTHGLAPDAQLHAEPTARDLLDPTRPTGRKE